METGRVRQEGTETAEGGRGLKDERKKGDIGCKLNYWRRNLWKKECFGLWELLF
jgi:hypothetical protein